MNYYGDEGGEKMGWDYAWNKEVKPLLFTLVVVGVLGYIIIFCL